MITILLKILMTTFIILKIIIMNMIFATLLNYFDSIEIDGTKIFQINLTNIFIFNMGLIYLLGSLFVITLRKRHKKIVKEQNDIITAKSKYQKLAARAAYLSKLTKLERATKELKAEQKLIERLTSMRKKNDIKTSIKKPYPFIPELDWPFRKNF